MPKSAAFLCCATLACLPAAPVLAALEGEMKLSPLPEVLVSYNDITGSVQRKPSCVTSEAKPIIIYDNARRVVALVYVTAVTDNC